MCFAVAGTIARKCASRVPRQIGFTKAFLYFWFAQIRLFVDTSSETKCFETVGVFARLSATRYLFEIIRFIMTTFILVYANSKATFTFGMG
jgi:hypothetical protein